MIVVKVWLLILTSLDGGMLSVQVADKGSCVRAGFQAQQAGRYLFYSCTEVGVFVKKK